MHLSLFTPILIWGAVMSRGMLVRKGQLKSVKDQKVDALSLSNTFTEKELLRMSELISFVHKYSNQKAIDYEPVESSSTITSTNTNTNTFQGKDLNAPISGEEFHLLSKMGLSETDIEEIGEILKVMKVPSEFSQIIEALREDELNELSEMNFSELQNYVKTKFDFKNEEQEDLSFKNEEQEDFSKIFSKRDAEPEPEPVPKAEPEPEPEPEAEPNMPDALPPKLLSSLYHPYAVSRMRLKRAMSGFNLRLPKTQGFGNYRHSLGDKSNSHEEDNLPADVIRRDIWLALASRSNEMEDKHDDWYAEDMIKRTLDSVESVQDVEGTMGVETISSLRKKRHVIGALMSMVGMGQEEEDPDEMLYMSAMMDGHKHEVLKTPSYYTPTESYKNNMARAKLLKTHP